MSNPDLLARITKSNAVASERVGGSKDAFPIDESATVDVLAAKLKKHRKEQKRPMTFYPSRVLEDRLVELKRATDLSMSVLIETLLADKLNINL